MYVKVIELYNQVVALTDEYIAKDLMETLAQIFYRSEETSIEFFVKHLEDAINDLKNEVKDFDMLHRYDTMLRDLKFPKERIEYLSKRIEHYKGENKKLRDMVCKLSSENFSLKMQYDKEYAQSVEKACAQEKELSKLMLENSRLKKGMTEEEFNKWSEELFDSIFSK